MFIQIVLALIPLTQFTSAAVYCNKYGRELTLKARYVPAYNGYPVYASCSNIDEYGCVHDDLEDPYKDVYGAQCEKQEMTPGDSTFNYECLNGDAVDDFNQRATEKGWNCE
ncbi:hypothetical protein CONCODRAFT_74343 [Conidiobolus coronatus NRRL 28638]|uniref:Uncharacterized protein n=1 Tax=Conidiobolus coronatus (strain ATCC 28846 / CBS 209.66 / NRRL 28638) TaxID=796925 RepID=A0A137NRG7_CONC2|nr:hypothetical protein CONCODRAFT_74343 [Conidiobolus coronatus NRRL 28638]|eukprot:KXN65327.1 hypothetical protein CONCODRAFT_74343 [Conidiobolus coronatus NRRL 28638]